MAMDLLRALPLPLLQSDGLVKQEQLVPGLLFDDLAGDANALPCAALFACDDAFPALDEFIASADFDSACGAAARGAARARTSRRARRAAMLGNVPHARRLTRLPARSAGEHAPGGRAAGRVARRVRDEQPDGAARAARGAARQVEPPR